MLQTFNYRENNYHFKTILNCPFCESYRITSGVEFSYTCNACGCTWRVISPGK